MNVADPLKLGIGLLLLLVAAVLFWYSRGSRGFNQKKQAAALAFAGGAFLIAVGLGLIQT